MTIWRPFTIENINLAQRIFNSVGYDKNEIQTYQSLSRMDRAIIDDESKRVYDEIMNQKVRESEIISEVLGSYRCRMFFFPQSDYFKEKFSDSNYSIAVTHMNHFSGPEEIIKDRFERIEKKLLEYNFPAEFIR